MAEIQIIARARDEASAVLRGLQGNMKQLFGPSGDVVADWSGRIKAADTALLGLDASARQVARSTTNLAMPIASQLSPAFSGLAWQAVNVVQGMTLVTGALGIAAVGAVGLAAIVGGKLLESWQKARQELLDFNAAMRSSDFDIVTAQVGTLAGKFKELSRALDELRQDAGPAGGVIERDSFLGRLFGLSIGQQQERVGLAAERAVEARAEARRLREQMTGAPGMTTEELNADLATIARGRFQTAQGQRGLLDFQRDPIEAAFAQAMRQAEDLERGAGGVAGDPEAAARVRRAAVEQRRFQFAERLGVRTAADVAQFPGGEDILFGGAGVPTIPVGTSIGEAARFAEGIRQLEILTRAQAPSMGGQAELIGLGPTVEERASGFERNAGLSKQILETSRQRVAIEQQLLGLNQDQADALEAERIAADLALKIAEARGNVELQNLATREAQVRTANLERARMLRTDATAGLVEGFRIAEEEASNWGTRMTAVAIKTSGDMSRTFSDGFFNVLTGQFEKMADVGQQFGRAIVRTITDELAALATAPILRSLRGALSGSGGLFAGVPLLGDLFTGGGGGAAGGAAAGAGLAPSMILVGGRYLSASDVMIAQAQAGPAGVQALGAGQAVISGGMLIGSPSAELLEATGRGGLFDRTATGFTFGQGLGLAATGALYGLSLYSAYQTTRNTSGVALNAGLGALQGALIGYQLGGSATGSAVGALAGAALSAGVSMFGKRNAEKQARQERRAAEVQQAVGAAGDLVSEANRAQSLQQFFDTLTAFGSGTSGGTRNPAVMTSVQTPSGLQYVGTSGSIGGTPVAGVEDLFSYLPTLQASIQAGVAPAELAGANEQASLALRERGQQLLDDYQARIGGVDVFAERQLDGGLTERTTVPGTRAAALGGEGGYLFADQLAIAGLSDDDREMFLRDLIRVAGDRGIRAFMMDPETDQIVSLANLVPGGGLVPPPGAPSLPPGVPPPGTEALDPEAQRIIQQIQAITPYPRNPVLDSWTEFSDQNLPAQYAAEQSAYYQQQIGQILSGADPALRDQVAQWLAAGWQSVNPGASPGETGPGAVPGDTSLAGRQALAAALAPGIGIGPRALGFGIPGFGTLDQAVLSSFRIAMGLAAPTPFGLLATLAFLGINAHNTAVLNEMTLLSSLLRAPRSSFGDEPAVDINGLISMIDDAEAAQAVTDNANAAAAAAATADAAAGVGGNTGTGPTGADAY